MQQPGVPNPEGLVLSFLPNAPPDVSTLQVSDDSTLLLSLHGGASRAICSLDDDCLELRACSALASHAETQHFVRILQLRRR